MDEPAEVVVTAPIIKVQPQPSEREIRYKSDLHTLASQLAIKENDIFRYTNIDKRTNQIILHLDKIGVLKNTKEFFPNILNIGKEFNSLLNTALIGADPSLWPEEIVKNIQKTRDPPGIEKVFETSLIKINKGMEHAQDAKGNISDDDRTEIITKFDKTMQNIFMKPEFINNHLKNIEELKTSFKWLTRNKSEFIKQFGTEEDKEDLKREKVIKKKMLEKEFAGVADIIRENPKLTSKEKVKLIKDLENTDITGKKSEKRAEAMKPYKKQAETKKAIKKERDEIISKTKKEEVELSDKIKALETARITAIATSGEGAKNPFDEELAKLRRKKEELKIQKEKDLENLEQALPPEVPTLTPIGKEMEETKEKSQTFFSKLAERFQNIPATVWGILFILGMVIITVLIGFIFMVVGSIWAIVLIVKNNPNIKGVTKAYMMTYGMCLNWVYILYSGFRYGFKSLVK